MGEPLRLIRISTRTTGAIVTQTPAGAGPSVWPLSEKIYTRLRLDRKGETWRLNPNGTWTDSTGETRDASWNPLIPLFGPWTRASEERTNVT